MSKILITGASGFVGQAVCRTLREAGHTLSGTSRDTSRRAGPENIPLYYVQADGLETDWAHAVTGADAVVHLAARVHVMKETSGDSLSEFRMANRDATESLAIAAVAAGVKRLVFLSTVKVNGERTEAEPFSEKDQPAPEDPYAISKWEAEQKLIEVAAGSGMEVIILRVPLVYGPHVGGNFLSLLRASAKGRPLPVAAISNFRSLLFVDNLAAAVSHSISYEGDAAGTYLLSDGEDVSTPDLIRRLSRALACDHRLFSMPVGLLKVAAACVGRKGAINRLTESLQIDSGLFRDRLGWRPPFSLDDGLAATAKWYRQQT